MMVVLGELGGKDEYSLVDALKQGKVQKPVVAWVSGTCARLFKSEVQFGHAVSFGKITWNTPPPSFGFLSEEWCIYYPEIFFSWDEQGAKSGGELESAQAKNQALREAGAIVPTSYEALESAIKEAFDKLVC